MNTLSPRIRPGSAREIGVVNALLTRLLGAATGGNPPNVFTTLARHRGLFRKWLIFAGGLMPGGLLSRRETELVILYVAQRLTCDYEWQHHERLARQLGVTQATLLALKRGDIATEQFSVREHAQLRAACELLDQGDITDRTYASLGECLCEREIIELCLLVGHYQMLAMTLKALRVALD